jgi:hypothetical protein
LFKAVLLNFEKSFCGGVRATKQAQRNMVGKRRERNVDENSLDGDETALLKAADHNYFPDGCF